MNIPLLYKKQPIFGVDIGHGTIKVVQITRRGSATSVNGYGFTHFDPAAVKDGVITDYETVAKAAYELFQNLLIGKVTTRRIAVALPVAHSFTRTLNLPKMEDEDLENAVRLETEQYVPIPLEQLYLDYEVAPLKSKDGEIEVLMVAAPKRLVDSYINLFDMLGLEIGVLEPSIMAITRAVRNVHPGNKPLLIVDFGSISSDLTVYDRTIRITSTIDGGSEAVTSAIAKELSITQRQAHTIKTQFGLNHGKAQAQIEKVVLPLLDSLIREIKKLVRYYQERTEAKAEVKDIIILGGGANLPGLTEYLKAKTGLEITICNPWEKLSFDRLQRPHPLEAALYTTAVGLSLVPENKI